MAKRFTDTDKWKRGVVKNSPMEYKLLWFYICDDCDNAGIWHPDFDVASIRIGVKVNEADAIKYLGNKIHVFDNGERWFIPSFIDFQYGELRPNNKAHISVIQKLERLGLMDGVKVGYTTPVNNNIDGKKRMDLFIRDEFTCTYCNQVFDVSDLQPDHILSLNKGGTNHLSNVTTSCKFCNMRKTDKPLDEFIEKMGFDKERIYLKINKIRSIYAPNDGAKDKDKDKEKEKVKEEGGTGETKLRPVTGIFPADEYLTAELPDIKIGAALQLATLTSGNKNITRQQIIDLWGIFKVRRFTGQNFYQSIEETHSHFINSLKFLKIGNSTAKPDWDDAARSWIDRATKTG